MMRVVYIEPYPKSKAFQFYSNEVSDSIVAGNKIVFEPFTGVGPKRFSDLFSMSSPWWYAKKRKDDTGKKIDWIRAESELRNPISPISYIELEEAALLIFEDETEAIKKGE